MSMLEWFENRAFLGQGFPSSTFLYKFLRQSTALALGKSYKLSLLRSRRRLIRPFGEYLRHPRYAFFRKNFLTYDLNTRAPFLVFIAYFYGKNP